MYAVNTYEEIERRERALAQRHIVALLFVRPSLPGAKAIIDEFNYLHHNSGNDCSLYAVGFTNNPAENTYRDYVEVCGVDGQSWRYSDGAFVAFNQKLEKRLSFWKYSGEIDMLLLQSNPDGREILDFSNYLVVDVNYGVRHGYIDSFPRFMTSLVRAAREHAALPAAVQQMGRERLSPRSVLLSALDSSKRIPSSAKWILKDKAFYRTSRRVRLQTEP